MNVKRRRAHGKLAGLPGVLAVRRPVSPGTAEEFNISCYEGDIAEKKTIVPIITSFTQRHNLEGTPVVVAADVGMLSAANLKALDELGCSFVVGSRATKAPGDLESHFHWNGDAFTDKQVIDTVTPRLAKSEVNDIALRAEPVWDANRHSKARWAIWAYSAKRARRDQKTLAAQEEHARAIIDGERPGKSARFVKVKGSDRQLDETALARAQSLVGLKGYADMGVMPTCGASWLVGAVPVLKLSA